MVIFGLYIRIKKNYYQHYYPRNWDHLFSECQSKINANIIYLVFIKFFN